VGLLKKNLFGMFSQISMGMTSQVPSSKKNKRRAGRTEIVKNSRSVKSRGKN
jgi:hypothetical protein